MASNFQLFSHRSGNSLHLQLYGDFDGDSAHQLINVLNKNGKNVLNVFIDTNDLSKVRRFGLSVFEKKLRTLPINQNNLIFLGKNKGSFFN